MERKNPGMINRGSTVYNKIFHLERIYCHTFYIDFICFSTSFRNDWRNSIKKFWKRKNLSMINRKLPYIAKYFNYFAIRLRITLIFIIALAEFCYKKRS